MEEKSQELLKKFTEKVASPDYGELPEGFLGSPKYRIPFADTIDQRQPIDQFRTPVFEFQMDPNAAIMAYSPQEKAEDKLLLRSLQRGDMGTGANIDKAIQDLINRISGVRRV